ncbi:large conductance mechanosensitive channel protein MscL [Nocardia alni]|uniref:large conductance mechanosensitive channel protein MscL n=1 Tax=Nocardia alni TaxID=2815723 RepID=UPI001C23A258|nr:large conductance mechanosensitive channel protein MscL [Nocardia alni]
MFKGFKDFLMRGNVIELSVAVVMGTAFTAVVSSVTKGVVQPLLAMLGGNSQFGLGFRLMAGKPATFIAIGPIVSAIIDFFMVAVVLYFVLILPMNTIKKRFSKPVKEIEIKPSQEELLTEIRDLLAAQNGSSPSEQTATTDSSNTGHHTAPTPAMVRTGDSPASVSRNSDATGPAN